MSSGISNLFEIGRSALYTAQRVLAVTGQNIANVNTPGYSKQIASITEARAQDGPGGQYGTGVLVTEVRRQVDSFVQSQLLGSFEEEGRLGASRTALFQLQGLVYNLVGVASSSNSGLLDVQFGTGGSATISISSLISNGALKGLLDARDTTIPGLQNTLDTLAASLAHEVNQLNTSGYGLDGSTGVNFFTALSVSSSAASTNTGAASVSASAITANSLLTMHDYEVRFSAANAYSIV